MLSALTVGRAWLIIWAISPMKSPIPCSCNSSKKHHSTVISCNQNYVRENRDGYAVLIVLIVVYTHVVEEPLVSVGEDCTRVMVWEPGGSMQ